jgi:DNA-binding response OmpR family regulator/predicted  nucleic acid-binding Zn-ribbon protein
MNASLSDGNEPVIDIFILSANSPLSTQLEKQLRDEGYYVTLFSDGTHLLETLRNGKPNLLMCDSTVSEADAFEVCRQIKADDFLWNIPVLIITGAADLGDLLRVLDCNADNFIAHPFDPPYLLSLIEGMLTIPVERQTPEQIKTQFKIKHDDQIFVVTADRRKLLEFLLSSFEIAVNKSTDLSRAQENIQNLGLACRKLEDTVHENSRVIGIINETLKTKEQKLAELTGQLADREQTVREKIAAIDKLSRDLSLEKSAHTEVRSEFGRVTKEKDEELAARRSAIDQLEQQVSDLSSEVATLSPALERTKEELLSESSRRHDTENELSTTTIQKDQAEKALGALTTEYEQLKINVGSEKNRASEAEHELQAVLQAKTQSEQDLTQIINDLKTTATQQATEINRLREESEYGHTRLSLTEENLRTVTAAKEQSEASLREAVDAGQKNIARLQEQLDTAGKVMDEQKQALQALNAELESAGAARQSVEQELASVSRTLEETKTALETETQNSASVKEDLARVLAEKEKAEALAESLAGSLKELQDQLEQEKGRYMENEGRMNTIILQRDQELGELRRMHKDAQTAVSSHKTSLEQMQRDLDSAVSSHKTSLEQMQSDLDSAVSARTELEENLRIAEEKIHRMSQELQTTSEGREQEKQQLSSLADELERVKTNLENETVRRQEAEDQLRDALTQQQQLEQDLERFVSETKALHADLAAERRMHEVTKKQNQSLEEQVSALGREKLEAEQAAADLTAEIDQARVALADEWEDHMTDHERLEAAVAEKKEQPVPVPSSGVRKEAEIIKKRALIVKAPSVPAGIRPAPLPMVAVEPEKVSEPEASHIKSVEDLYEDDENLKKKTTGDRPVVSIIEEPATEPVRDVLPDTISDRSGEQESFFEEETPSAPGTRDTAGEDSLQEQDETETVSGEGTAFDREQWLDMLRWSHHCDTLTQDQRMQIVRMGRLIQKGRKLTKKQEEQVVEMIALVRRLGYRFT